MPTGITIAPEINTRFYLATLDTPGGRERWGVVPETRPRPDAKIEAIQSMLDQPGRDRSPITQLQPWFGS